MGRFRWPDTPVRRCGSRSRAAEFITSRFYYDRYPDWVNEWNSLKLAEDYAGESWELLSDASTYRFGGADDRPYETALPGFGRVFPHPYGGTSDPYYMTLLTVSPAGDELTVNFAKAVDRRRESRCRRYP